MAKTANITKYVCDKTSKVEYLTESDPRITDWHEIKRYTADGVEITRLLCKEAYAQYKTLTAKQDQEFNTFMQKGIDQ